MNTSTQTISHKLCRCSNIYGKDECSIQNSKEIHFQWLLRIINLLYILYIAKKPMKANTTNYLPLKRDTNYLSTYSTQTCQQLKTLTYHTCNPPIFLMIFKYNHLQIKKLYMEFSHTPTISTAGRPGCLSLNINLPTNTPLVQFVLLIDLMISTKRVP